MQILSRDSLPLGGFAGLTEHRLVTDSRVFGPRKQPGTSEGLGNFVYLADARFNPKGETGMHPHRELDVISVMIEGRVGHEGSLEHGKVLEQGAVQVQRAGCEGFAHNEVNPDSKKNRMIQLWALPDEAGQRAGYKYYQPKDGGTTRVYGGNKNQTGTFDSRTIIDIVRLTQGNSVTLNNRTLAYVTTGRAKFQEGGLSHTAKDGELINSRNAVITAASDTQLIVISHL